jgi:hypothetical protein
MSRRKFAEHGLQQVPDFIRRDCACQICGDDFPNRGALWTQESLREPDSPRLYHAWVDKIRRNSYCTTHAESHVVGQQYFLSKDGRTKYVVSRNFPEDS